MKHVFLYSPLSIHHFQNNENLAECSECAPIIGPACQMLVPIFLKNILIRFDVKTSSKMDESENVLDQGNPYVFERPCIHQFLSKS